MTLKINEKFKNFLPALTPEEAAQLEESITKNGCESPLMTWNNQIIDGHNRFNICTKTDIPFAVVDRTDDFETEDDVIEWILTNQLGRRNLSHSQKTLYIGELYEVRKKRVGEHKGNQYTEKRKSDTVTEFQSQESIRHHVELIPNEEIKPEIEQKIEYDEGYKPKPPPTKRKPKPPKPSLKISMSVREPLNAPPKFIRS